MAVTLTENGAPAVGEAGEISGAIVTLSSRTQRPVFCTRGSEGMLVAESGETTPIHVPAYSLFVEPLSGAAHAAIDRVRDGGGVVSVDLSSVAGLNQYGPARMAYDLARLRPELLFATGVEAGALAVPLEGLAKVPVLKLGAAGCQVFGRTIPAPLVREVDATGAGDALAAAFCASYLDGATPIEAAGRAVLVAAGAVTRAGARP